MASIITSRDGGSLADFLNILRLRKALIFLILALVLLTTLGVTALLPRWYLSTVAMRVEKPESEVKLFQAQSSSYYDPYFLQDQFKTIQSDIILKPVIEILNLNAVLGKMLNNGEPLPTSITAQYLLRKMLRVESQRSSSIIEIDVYAQEPALAARIANEIARVYSENRINFATAGQREGMTELKKQLAAQEEVVSKQRPGGKT